MRGKFYSSVTAVLRLVLVLALVSAAERGSAQSGMRTITGSVKDAHGPVLAATVVVVGTTIGVSTGMDGDFSIRVPDDARKLRISYIGYEDAEVDILPSQTVYDVVLHESTNVLDDVVVVGYGVQKRSDLTGAVSSVSSKVLEAMPVSSAAEAITGRMAGVHVTTSEGGPDAEIKVRVRGGGSISQDNSPLFIVDGFPVSSINDIAPGDIQSIDVLKDASSTAIYGARGANGVVIVTTKSGKEGKTSVGLNLYFGWKYLSEELDVMNAYDYVMYQYELNNYKSNTIDYDSGFTKYYGVFGDLELYKNRPSINWQDEVFGRLAFTQNYNASITGGSDKIKYNIGLTHMDDESIMIGSGFMRNNINLKLKGNICKGLTFDATARYSHTRVTGAGASEEGGSSQPRLRHTLSYAPTNGLADLVAEGEDYLDELENTTSLINPVEMTNDEYKEQVRRYQTYNGALNWTIVKGLLFRTEWGVETRDERVEKFYGMNTSPARKAEGQPLANVYDKSLTRWRGANTLSFSKKFGDLHDFTIMVGQEINSDSYRTQTVEVQHFPTDISRETALSNLTLGDVQPVDTFISAPDNLLSFFGRVNYSYNDRYIFTASLRADGSSKFSEGNRWGYFPSAAVAWRLSEESFLKDTEWLSNLKLRFSYGASGNNRLENGRNLYLYEVNTKKQNVAIGGETASVLQPSTILANPKLKWETTVTRNLGLDFGFFGGRLSGSVDAYWNSTKDLLLRKTIPSATGYTHQYQNIGETSNKGIEVVLDAVLVEKKNFRLAFNANLAWNRNRIESYGDLTRTVVGSEWSGAKITNDYLIEVGKAVGQMYGYVSDGFYTVDDFDYVDAGKGTANWTLKEGIPDGTSLYGGTAIPGAMKLRDLDGNGVVDDKDRRVVGCAQPLIVGGFSLSAQFYGFDVAAYFNYSYGNDVYNANKMEHTSLYQTRKYWNKLGIMRDRFRYIDPVTGANLLNDYDALAALNKNAKIWTPDNITTGILTDWAIEDGSFLRLSNVTVGYTLPKHLSKKIGMEQLRFYVTGTNLWLWTGYSGYDPEVDSCRKTPLTPSVDYSAFPRARQFVVGANITF